MGDHLQHVGAEFGVTTGRRRRCGWLDLVVLKHSCLINGYDALNLTKLDVLDDLDEIKIGIGYVVDGQILPGFPGQFHCICFDLCSMSHESAYPADLDILGKVEVAYITLSGWKSDISGIREYSQLPDNCRTYVETIEERTGVPVEWIGVGAGRDAMIRRTGA